jgi:hypothetical protein
MIFYKDEEGGEVIWQRKLDYTMIPNVPPVAVASLPVNSGTGFRPAPDYTYRDLSKSAFFAAKYLYDYSLSGLC